MKRLILSTSMVMLVAAAFAPIASASGQISTTQSLPEGASLTDLVRHNRDARGN